MRGCFDNDARAALEELANALQVFVVLLDVFRERATNCQCRECGDLYIAADRSAAAVRHLHLCLNRAGRKEKTP